MVAARIPLLPPILDAEAQALYQEIASGRRGRVAGPLALWLYSPALGRRLATVGEYLRWETSLAPQEIEACILVVAAHYRCRYIWDVHQPLATTAGVEQAWIDCLQAGMATCPSSLRTRLAVTLVRSMLHQHELSDELFADGLNAFGERGLCELTALIGYYTSGALLLNAVRVGSGPGDAFGRDRHSFSGGIARSPSTEMLTVATRYAREKDAAHIDEVFDAAAMRSLLERFPGDRPPESTGLTIAGVQCMTLANRPAPPATRTLVYVHGGGFVAGGWRSHGAWAATLARALRAQLIFPLYRRAPEYRYPAATLDVLAVARDIAQGSHTTDWLLAADSAGAALALQATALLRDEGVRLPLGLVLLCGMFDLDVDSSSYLARSHRAREMVSSYVTQSQARHSAINPLLADLHGFPPTLLQLGGADALRDDGLRLAEKMATQGIAVTLECWPGQVHAWHRLGVDLPDVQAACSRVARFVETIAGPRPAQARDS